MAKGATSWDQYVLQYGLSLYRIMRVGQEGMGRYLTRRIDSPRAISRGPNRFRTQTDRQRAAIHGKALTTTALVSTRPQSDARTLNVFPDTESGAAQLETKLQGAKSVPRGLHDSTYSRDRRFDGLRPPSEDRTLLSTATQYLSCRSAAMLRGSFFCIRKSLLPANARRFQVSSGPR